MIESSVLNAWRTDCLYIRVAQNKNQKRRMTMKNDIRNFLLGAGLTAMLWAPFLKAEENLAVAKIPFDFQVNQTSLPAGTYTVIMHTNMTTIRLRNNNTGKSVMLMPPGRETNTNSQPLLSFRQYSD